MGNVFYRNINETIKYVLHALEQNSMSQVLLLDVCRIRDFFKSTLQKYNESCRKIFEDEEIMNIYAQIIRVL